MLRYSQEGEE
jgi:hypothetical protein